MGKVKGDAFNYYDEFIKNVEYSVACAEMILKIVQEFNVENLEDDLKRMHQIENCADKNKHEITNYLIRDFLPPIEREDIMGLLQKVDDVTDLIEEILINFDIFHITQLKATILAFAELLVECCKLEYEIMVEFKEFKKSKTIKSKVIALNKLEEDGDRLYIESMRVLYRECEDPLQISIWTKIYNCFEDCFDMCEKVADDIETICLKNS